MVAPSPPQRCSIMQDSVDRSVISHASSYEEVIGVNTVAEYRDSLLASLEQGLVSPAQSSSSTSQSAIQDLMSLLGECSKHLCNCYY